MAVNTEEIVATDRLDRQLIHALRIDGRAPFRRLADVLGASEQTVARRYRRLREAGAIRVVVVPNPRHLAENWYVRVRVQPPHALALAEAVARRSEVSWVGLTSGGAEVTFATRTRTAAERDALLLERLPRSRQVVDVDAVALLHAFDGGPAATWAGLEDPLAPDQVAALVAARPAPTGPLPAHVEPDLLAALAADGRASYAALADRLHDTPGRIARRVDALLGAGVLLVDVELAFEPLGVHASAMLWATVTPAHLDAVGHQLIAHPSVSFVGAMSGKANLMAHVAVRDSARLYDFLTDQVAPTAAIQAVEVSPVLRLVKHASTLSDGPRLPAPV